eukprot:scaffold1704_cov246-Pinguiococcus_pyrenoidosus.AAC.13
MAALRAAMRVEAAAEGRKGRAAVATGAVSVGTARICEGFGRRYLAAGDTGGVVGPTGVRKLDLCALLPAAERGGEKTSSFPPPLFWKRGGATQKGDAARNLHEAECDAFIASTRAAKSSGCDVDLLRIVARLLWSKALDGRAEYWEAAGRLLSHQYDLAATDEEARLWKASVFKVGCVHVDSGGDFLCRPQCIFLLVQWCLWIGPHQDAAKAAGEHAGVHRGGCEVGVDREHERSRDSQSRRDGDLHRAGTFPKDCNFESQLHPERFVRVHKVCTRGQQRAPAPRSRGLDGSRVATKTLGWERRRNPISSCR